MVPKQLSDAQQQFVEQFALAWASMANARMDGRIIGLFLIIDQPYLASADIAALLNASAGAVSMSTRKLAEASFIHRHVVPGDRKHYFAADDDIWGGFLRSERAYLQRMAAVLETAEALIEPDAAGPRKRLTNAQNYVTWLHQHHPKMFEEWIAYRDKHDPENRHG